MILKLSCMTSKEFHICYRRAVSSMIRRMRGVYLVEHSERVSDKDLAAVLKVKPTTFSRLSRGCFSASPVVLLRLVDQLGVDVVFNILNTHHQEKQKQI